MSTILVDTINEKTSGNGVAIPGHVVQVVSTTKTDTQTITGQTFTDVLTATITPKFSNSKIYVTCTLNFTNRSGSDSDLGERYGAAKLFRDSTQIALGDASGSREQVWFSSNTVNGQNNAFTMFQSSGSFLDSPATTSATTYKVKCASSATSTDILCINRTGPDNDANYSHRGASTLTLLEIAQ